MKTPLILAACIAAYATSVQMILHPSIPQNFAILVNCWTMTTIAAYAIDSPFIQLVNRVTYTLCILTDHILLYTMPTYPYNMLACSMCVFILYGISYYYKTKSARENLVYIANVEITLLDVFALALQTAMHMDIVLLLSRGNS